MKINSIIDLVKDLDTSRQTKNLNKLLIRILLHLQVEFSNEYLNNIGNLSLLTWGNNSAKKNHNPANDGVVEMYNSIFYSHKEIYETLKSEKKWNEIQISERRDRIVAFIKDNWLD